MTESRPAPRGGRSAIPVADVMSAFTSVFLAVNIALVAAFAAVPDIREWLASPTGLVAWTAVATLALAVGVGFWAAGRTVTSGRVRFAVPVAAAVLLAQALRLGAGYLGFAFPSLQGVEVASLSDLREAVAAAAIRFSLGPVTALAALFLTAGLTVFAMLRVARWARGRVLVTDPSSVILLTAALGSEAAIPGLGLFGQSPAARFCAVMVALVAAELLVLAGLTAGSHRRTVAGWRRRIWPWLAEDRPLAGIPTD